MKVPNMGVIGGGSGRPVNQLWLWTSSNNPDVVDETSPENFEWTGGANLLPAQFSPPGGLPLASTPPFTSLIKIQEGVTYPHISARGLPLPPAWVRNIASVYSLANLDSWANYDNYELSASLLAAGWMKIKIDALDLSVDVDTCYIVVKEDDSVAYFYGNSIKVGTDLLLMPALVAANPGGFGSGELTIEWRINNG